MQNNQQNIMTWNDALTHYGLDYTVEKRPLVAMLGNGQTQLVDNLFSIVRSDTGNVLPGVAVNGRYECIQTTSYADIGNAITQQLNATFVRGGVLMNGRGLFLQAKLPDSIRVKGTDDKIDKLLTFVTSHDGSLSFMVMATALRLFCSNQMNALMRDAREGVKIRHTASAKDRLQEVEKKILTVLNAYRQFEVKVDWLADQRFTDIQMEVASRRLFGVKDDVVKDDIPTRTKNNIETVQRLFTEGQGQHLFRGTAWAAYNAMTEYADHERALRKDSDRFEASLIGSGAMLKAKAINVIDNVLAKGSSVATSVHPA